MRARARVSTRVETAKLHEWAPAAAGLSPRAYPIRILDPDTVPLVLACALAALPLALALPLPLTKRRVLARNLARDVDEKLCVTENLLCS